MKKILPPPESIPAKFLDAKGCGARYHFSKEHWYRQVDAGKAPQPTRFGRLVRWSIGDLEEWEAEGCPPVRTTRKGGRQ